MYTWKLSSLLELYYTEQKLNPVMRSEKKLSKIDGGLHPGGNGSHYRALRRGVALPSPHLSVSLAESLSTNGHGHVYSLQYSPYAIIRTYPISLICGEWAVLQR